MPEITKQDIKEIFLDSFEPFARSIQEEFVGVNAKLDGVDKRLDGMDKRFDGVDKRLDDIDKRLDGMDARLGAVEVGLGEIGADVQWMKENSGELFGKLDRFIALYEESRQEMAVMAN